MGSRRSRDQTAKVRPETERENIEGRGSERDVDGGMCKLGERGLIAILQVTLEYIERCTCDLSILIGVLGQKV